MDKPTQEGPQPTSTALSLGGSLQALRPQTFEDVQRIARLAVRAGLSPSGRYGLDEETKHAQATMAILQGLECGIPPIQALQGISIINGRALIYGDLLTALLWSKGFKIKKWLTGTGDARTGHARITRPDGEVIEKSFSVTQAKQARLWDTREKVRKRGQDKSVYEADNDSPWFRFGERMLEWRAFGWCVKDGASDATHGMLVYEEASDDANRMVDVTPADEQPTARPAKTFTRTLEIPDEDPPAADPQPVQVQDEAPGEPPPDVSAWLEQLRLDREHCESEEDLDILRESNKATIAALKPRDRKKANEILKSDE